MTNADEATRRFADFQKRMHEWEVRFHPLMSQNIAQYQESARSELKSIFDEYVYKYRDDYGRMSGPDISFPPDYDPNNDIIERVEEGKNRVTIYVKKTTQFDNYFRFILRDRNGRWMIEKAEIYWSDTEKWGVFNL